MQALLSNAPRICWAAWHFEVLLLQQELWLVGELTYVLGGGDD